MNLKIAISGDLGSGKSTVSKILVEELGFQYHSGGTIFRNLAKEYNMTPIEFSKYAEIHEDVDKQIDDKLREISCIEESIIVDSRMAWYFVDGSFKVHLIVDTEVAAKRIVNANRGVEKYKNLEDAIIKLENRKKSENKRYSEKYNVDATDLSNYDLVIDTTKASPKEVASLIIEKMELLKNGVEFNTKWSKSQGKWVSE